MNNNIRPQLVPELGCRDVLVSRNFYVDILGFQILYDRPDKGFYYLERQGVEIMIEQLSESSWLTGELEGPFGCGLHFQIMTCGLKGLYEACKSNGVPIFREWEDAWYRAGDDYVGQSQFIVCDPDGYMLRFAEDIGKKAEPPEAGRVVG